MMVYQTGKTRIYTTPRPLGRIVYDTSFKMWFPYGEDVEEGRDEDGFIKIVIDHSEWDIWTGSKSE